MATTEVATCKHYWITRGVTQRDVNALDKVYVGPLYRWCNRCHKVDRTTPVCEAFVDYRSGNWPRTTNCQKAGTVESPIPPGWGNRETDGKTHFYCKSHDPEEVARRAAVKEAKANERYVADTWARRLGYEGGKTSKLLEEILEWAEQNEDLVEADEWLGTIIKDVTHAAKIYRKEGTPYSS